MPTCKFCELEKPSIRSIRSHEVLCKSNPNRKISPFENPEAHRNKSNQFLSGKSTGHSENTKQLISEKLNDFWSTENRSKQSEKMKQIMPSVIASNPESYSSKNVCGRAKKSIYNGQLMHSSWEELVAKWFDENDIVWTRETKAFIYEWKGIRKYFPDFFLPDLNLYIEVKGYTTDRDKAKWASIDNLVVFQITEIERIKNRNLSLGILRGREHRS